MDLDLDNLGLGDGQSKKYKDPVDLDPEKTVDTSDSSDDEDDDTGISKDRQFLSVIPGDKNVEITGIVQSVDMEREYGEGTNKKTLQTFIIGNLQTKRIRCLIWGSNRIKDLRKIVQGKNIIQMIRGDAKIPNMKFFPTNDKNLLKVELQILKDTEVKLVGEYNPKKIKKRAPSKVDFKSIDEAEGDIVIEGFVKQTFATTSADRMTCIVGALTDGNNKINLRIRDTENAKDVILLEKGQKVQVSGYLDCDENTGMLEIISPDVTSVKVVPGAEKLSKKRCSTGSLPIFKKKRANDK